MLRDFCKHARTKPARKPRNEFARAVGQPVDHQSRVVEAYGLLVGRCMNILHTVGHGSMGNTKCAISA
jgi:hypothetical protein